MTKQKKLMRKDGLYLAHAGYKGRGVFCTSDIRKGEMLEVTPAILLGDEETNHIDRTILMNYAFSVGKISAAARKAADLKPKEYVSAVVMGVMSFCNHTESPNAEISWEEQNGSVYYVLEATADIKKGTEICTSYGENWLKDRGL